MRIVMLFLTLIFFAPNAEAKKFHVDFVATSSEGCTFHIVGDVELDIAIPLINSTVTGFVGTVTIGGASGCPKGTFIISYGLVTAGSPSGFGPGEEIIINQILWDDPAMRDEIDNLMH